jgi:hypothetical protein
MGIFGRVKDAAKEYAAETRQAWRETPPQSTRNVRALEQKTRRSK